MKNILIVMAFYMIAGQAQAYNVEITQAELQAMVATGFPIQQQMPFVNAILSDPKIHIVAGRNRLRLSVKVNATFQDTVTSAGLAEIEGELDYDPAKGEFHLREPTVTRLQFEQLPKNYDELASSLISGLAQQALPIIVIYRLDEKDLKQAMTRRVLKGVSVRDGKLIADLDW